jgi:adenylate cyclase
LPSISSLLKRTRVRLLGLSLLAFAGLVIANALGLGLTLENDALDVCYRHRPQLPSPSELAIVGIDEQSFQELRRAWPWPRRLHAELVRRLKAAGAKLIVFDVIFAEPSDPPDDEMFTKAIQEAGNVILATTIELTENRHVRRQILVQPYQPFRAAARAVGLTLVTPDGDGIVRRFSLRFREEKNLSEVVARCYRPDLEVPSNLSGFINFTGPPGHIYTISYGRVLNEPEPSLLAHLRGKIVLIGRVLEASPTPMADAFYTPFFSTTGQLMSGVEIHAQVINTLLHQDWGQEVGLLPRLGFYLFALLLFGYVVGRVSPFAGVGVLAGFVVAIFVLSFLLFLHLNFWLPPLLLAGAMTLVYGAHIFIHYSIEAKEKRWLRQAFSHYVSDSLVESIIAHPERLQLGGEEVEVTVLFADLVNFSALAENVAPRELISLLNEYFSVMTEIIMDYKGTVDKFIGDAIMAFWGAPLPLADHALLACKAALEMQSAMHSMRGSWGAQGFHQMSTCIGIHSGPVVAGNVGSRRRFNYTVMGDTVNLAARLQGANKAYGTEIILSEATRRRLTDTFLLREMDLIQVRGRSQSVTIYELISFMPPAGPPGWLRLFEAGRADYLEGKIQEAATRFHEILDLHPDDPPSKIFLERCHKRLEKKMVPNYKDPVVLGNN